MTTSTSLSAIDPGLAALAFAREATLNLAEGITDEQLTHRPQAGANHAAWILGHLAYADNGFYTKLSGNASVLPDNFDSLFGMGTEPTDDAGVYPSKSELLATLEKSHATITDWFRNLSDEQLAAPLPEGFERFGPNHAALAATLAWHEGIHAGQLIEVRRSLGLPRAFG